VTDQGGFVADSSVSDISSRTGFVQSHVSVSVARLVQRGLVETFTDPTDGCRTRVRFRAVAVRAVTARAGRDVHDVLAAVGIDVDRARRVGGILSIEVRRYEFDERDEDDGARAVRHHSRWPARERRGRVR
jgi:hypothetical protein